VLHVNGNKYQWKKTAGDTLLDTQRAKQELIAAFISLNCFPEISRTKCERFSKQYVIVK
jgi:hypothetical protein